MNARELLHNPVVILAPVRNRAGAAVLDVALLAHIARVAAAIGAERIERAEAEQAVAEAQRKSAVFAQDSITEQIYTLENDKIKLNISTRGGRITLVNLKEYCTHDSLPLILWKEDASTLGMNFYARNQEINTEKFLFVPNTTETTLYAKNETQTLSMRLYADSSSYIEYRYTLLPDSYITDFSIITHNMGEIIASNSSFLTLYWGVNMPQLEKSKDFEAIF